VTELRGARAAQLAAQAKVNLRLRILAREAGGFHQIETLFLRLALADTVRVRRTGSGRSLDISGLADAAQLGPADKNLAWRAAEMYFDAAGWSGGWALELEKRIPVGGGLGGGSADAGAVLRALDAIAPDPLGEAALLRIAGMLGSDVPFLTSAYPYALAWGRGERMLALPAPPSRELLLVDPGFGVNTGAAYGWLVEHRATGAGRGTGDPRILDPASLGEWDGIAAVAVNDFEPVVAARHPEIDGILGALRALGCTVTMMSGSGSTLFGVAAAGAAFGPAAELAPRLAEREATPRRVIASSTATRVESVIPLD
jgi:4-diphosphocytidyl-2-C-methyl-D-erythritol kinase